MKDTSSKSTAADAANTTTTTTEGDQNVVRAEVYDGINKTVTSQPHIPSVSATAVLGESASMPDDTPKCRGHDFSPSPSPPGSTESSHLLDDMIRSFRTTGFQATNLALAVEQVRQMRSWRLSDREWVEGQDDIALQPIEIRKRIRCRIFFAYTSNQISCGQREVIRFLVQHKMVDAIVTTAGGIEEDLIKCFHPTYMGDFGLKGRDLRQKGINRIGNLLIPNNNYCDFEDWISPIINKMHDEQDQANVEWSKHVMTALQSQSQQSAGTENGDACVSKISMDDMPTRFVWTPSKMIARLGKEINHPDSVLYWAYKNDIPIFCPALTDGSIGDMLFFHSYKRKGFVLDINEDVRRINDLAVKSHCTGQIILGGGVIKHHTCNANLMRNGADYSVYVNTASEYDGSDSGASPDEAVSWGKIRINAKPVKVTADATIVFPLIVSQTFANNVNEWKESVKDCVCWIDDIE